MELLFHILGSCTDRINGFECACKAGFSRFPIGSFIETSQGSSTRHNRAKFYFTCVSHYSQTISAGYFQTFIVCFDRINNFSCVCNVGYTGGDCDVITIKCSNDSCYPGVPCTDKTVPISCGPFPSGFTGNGKNCQCNNNPVSLNTLGTLSLNGKMEGIWEIRGDIF